MMLCRTVVINYIYLEIFTQAIQKISTGRGGAADNSPAAARLARLPRLPRLVRCRAVDMI
jgi:hypothetical protein